MPNWCDLDVKFVGAKADLEAIIAKGSEGTFEHGTDWNKETRSYDNVEVLPNVFSFENFAPTPADLKDTTGMGDGMAGLLEAQTKGREGSYGDWYSWRVGNWGTKWDLDQLGATSVGEITETDEAGVFQFFVCSSTAWAPAFEIFATITEQYPVKAIYRYAEEGMNFFGQAFIEDGEIDDDSREITPEDYEKAGAVLDEDGNVDWDLTTEYDLYKVL